MESLRARLERKEIILIDGGIGTEIERRGVTMDNAAWCGAANKTHSDVVRAMHADYVRAGAGVITANTFATARHVLEPAGFGDEVETINRTAVRLAREARDEAADGPVWIAGSMSSTGPLTAIGLPDDARAGANYREQAELLAEAGIDLIIAEMMTHTGNATLVVEAALQTDLPVWVGFSAERNHETGRIMPWCDRHVERLSGDLGDTIDAIVALGGADVMGIMHTKLGDMDPAFEVLRERWSGPTLAYAESGLWKPPSWKFVGVVSPEDYAQSALGWVASGIQVIGGCCGTGPAHIHALRDTLPRQLP